MTMAAELSLRSIEKEIADITECAICAEVYQDPRSLPCLHTFCLGCIEKFSISKQPGASNNCPLCRVTFSIPSNGLSGLPKNFLIERMKLIKELSVISSEKRAFCKTCSGDQHDPKAVNRVTVFCIECRSELCDDCDRAHENAEPNRHHRRISIRNHNSSAHVGERSEICERHSEEKLMLFCMKCKAAICMLCSATLHEFHECLDINVVVEEFQYRMNADVTQLSDAVDSLRNVLQHLLSDRQEFIRVVDKLEDDVCNKAERLKHTIECNQQALLMELKALKRERVKEVNHLSEDIEQHISMLNSLKQYVEELQQNGTICTIGQEITTLGERAKKLMKFGGIESSLDKVGAVDVKLADVITACSVNLVGKIEITKIPFPFKLEVSVPTGEESTSHNSREVRLNHVIASADDRPVCAVALLEDRLFVARREDIEVYDTATFTLQHRMDVPGLVETRGIAGCRINCCLYVSDHNRTIHRVNLQKDARKRLLKWQIDGSPYGLSVNDRTNLVIACGSSPPAIVEYTTCGSLVRVIELADDLCDPWHAVQLTGGQFGGNFLVCHGWTKESLHRVCVVDSSGMVVASYGTVAGPTVGRLNVPRHLAVDRVDGSVFVADFRNNRIVVLDRALNWLRELPATVEDAAVPNGPQCVCLLQELGVERRLCVGEWRGQKRVLIFENVS